MANFIPPANGASQGNFFQAKIPKMAVYFASPEIIDVKIRHRQTDRQIL